VDPSGHFGFKKFFKTVVTIAIMVAVAYVTGGMALSAMGISGSIFTASLTIGQSMVLGAVIDLVQV
jgi:predicted phage tail protein